MVGQGDQEAAAGRVVASSLAVEVVDPQGLADHVEGMEDDRRAVAVALEEAGASLEVGGAYPEEAACSGGLPWVEVAYPAVVEAYHQAVATTVEGQEGGEGRMVHHSWRERWSEAEGGGAAGRGEAAVWRWGEAWEVAGEALRWEEPCCVVWGEEAGPYQGEALPWEEEDLLEVAWAQREGKEWREEQACLAWEWEVEEELE